MMDMTWKSVLKEVLTAAMPLLDDSQTRWAVIGSVATALQGCRVIPGDIDILAARPEGVYRFAELMSCYAPLKSDLSDDLGQWQSTLEKPVTDILFDNDFHWYFGRWFVEGVEVEIAHIIAPEDHSADGIWEAGPEIWPHIKLVRFEGIEIPVVPLEIQLETNLQRGLDQRVAEIISGLKREGYDRELLEKAVSPRYFYEVKGKL